MVGPTATGKSDLAVELALRLDGEVVSADAMQLYRGMDIGTAKLTSEQRRGVPHHQLDVLDVTQEASLAAYQRAARAAIGQIRERGRRPVLAGGSGLYVRAALDALVIPPTDPDVRAALEDRLHEIGPAALHAELARADPVAAQSILASNGRRIVRALEVIELTGEPFSAVLPEPTYAEPTVQVGLAVERSELDERTGQRVDRMWQLGLVAEVERLAASGLRDGPDRVARGRLRPGARGPRRPIDARPGPGADGPGDPTADPAAGVVVRPRPTHPVARTPPRRIWSSRPCARPHGG